MSRPVTLEDFMSLISTLNVTECCKGLIWGAGGVMVDSWLGTALHSPNCPILDMNLTKSFPPTDDLIAYLAQVDYQKLYADVRSFVLTVAAFVAVVATILWNKIQTMKFKTPEMFTQFFYLGVNMIGEPGDEIVGLSVGNRYVGLYNNGIAWGVLNEQGALTNP
jgi:hypothetical protein